jgi:hypothetical protein
MDPRERGKVVNVFETWSWRRMLKIKWMDRITNGEVFQRAKEERLILKYYKIRVIYQNEFVVNILEGAILTYLLTYLRTY